MCMRPMHRLIGAYAGGGVAYLAHWTLPALPSVAVVAASAAIAAATAPGPDVDQRRWWRTLDRWLPDEWLGWGGPLQHRGITHFWGVPAVTAALLVAVSVAHPGPWWVAWAGLAGWVSHLAADWVFGMASPYDHRGAGIPFLPWSHHHGLGLDVGGPTETVARWVLSVAPVALLWHVATG
jgi:hypothetical protein